MSALPNTTVPGRVTALAPTSTTVSNVVTYEETISLTNPPPTVKLGMTAQVNVVVSSKTNVLEVPTSAITTTGRVSTVTVLRNGKQTVENVTTGLKGDNTTEILSGLSAGQEVVEPTVTVGAATSSSSGSGTGTLTGGGLGGGGLGGFPGGAGVFRGTGGGAG